MGFSFAVIIINSDDKRRIIQPFMSVISTNIQVVFCVVYDIIYLLNRLTVMDMQNSNLKIACIVVTE